MDKLKIRMALQPIKADILQSKNAIERANNGIQDLYNILVEEEFQQMLEDQKNQDLLPSFAPTNNKEG